MKRYSGYSSIFGRWRFESTSSRSSSCQPKRSASARRSSSASMRSRWTQVRPCAVSSASARLRPCDVDAARAAAVLRRMRGRLGIGTERVVDRRHHVRDLTPIACNSRVSGSRLGDLGGTGIAAAGCAVTGVRRTAAAASARAASAAAPAARQTAAAASHQRVRRDLEHEAADGRADGEPDAPGERRERHVAADQPVVGEVGDERRLHRPVQALADREDRERDAGRRRARPCPRRPSPPSGIERQREPPRRRRAAPASASGAVPRARVRSAAARARSRPCSRTRRARSRARSRRPRSSRRPGTPRTAPSRRR